MEDIYEEFAGRYAWYSAYNSYLGEKYHRDLSELEVIKEIEYVVTQVYSDSTMETHEALKKEFEETEDDLKYLSTTKAELVGEIVKPHDEERLSVHVKIDEHRYIVNCSSEVDQSKLVPGTRVTNEQETLTIIRILPSEVNPLVYKMIQTHHEDVSYSDLCGLSGQIEVLKWYIELPLTNPEHFQRVGVRPPKGVLLYGPPGTGKTLLARAIGSNTNSTFLTVGSNELLSLGGSPLLVREIFKYAGDHQPCIIFMDEIDAIGRRRTIRETGTSLASNRDSVLMELFSQLDGLNEHDKVKVIMATNRPDLLDSALIRPGRIDQKIKIPLPNESSRMRIFQIHASGITKQGEIDFEKIVKLSEGFNGADMCNICTEAGMFALRAVRDYILSDDFIKAVNKIGEAKKLESNAEYNI